MIKTGFQFQYGTIKRAQARRRGQQQPKFQFQYGTIKSHPKLRECHQVPHFNSSMVRLKVEQHAFEYECEYISIPVWYD